MSLTKVCNRITTTQASWTPLCSTIPHRTLGTDLFPVTVIWPLPECHLNGIILCAGFCVCLLSLSVMLSCFIRVAYVRISVLPWWSPPTSSPLPGCHGLSIHQ